MKHNFPSPLMLSLLLTSFALTACSPTSLIKQDVAKSAPEEAIQPVEEYSRWHHESLILCEASSDAVTQFDLPERVDIWDRVREGFSLPEESHRRIIENMSWYARHPSYISRVTERAAPYMYYIVSELDRRNMPMELALLPIVESAFDPFAYSHGRASGMWQIIPGTGKMLGLKQNWWYDGRRDIVASTDAALDYLEQLHKQFDGDWLHALAAYNSGAGNVNKAMRRNKRKGRPTDYWSLDLPRETEGYVPRLLALKELFIRPDMHNLALFSIPNEPYFRAVDVGSQIDLAQAAELAELSMDELYHLNPGFNRWATAPKGPHNILVPIAIADEFEYRVKQIPTHERVTWDRYKIKSGDTLSTIAKRYNTTTELLRDVNNVSNHLIREGKTLLVPIATGNSRHYTQSVAQRIKKRQATGSGQRIEYVVKPGDSIWTISRQHKVNMRSLAKWNGIAPTDPIKPGQKLVIWKKQGSSNPASSGMTRKIRYKVRKGDSLARIADKFNLKTANILSWNSVNPNKYLHPGQMLTLFVDVTKAP